MIATDLSSSDRVSVPRSNGTGVLDVLIAGAGFSGLGMAIRLREEGKRSFLVIEKADDIGGTWYFNRYPGCACDIPSHLYSFSFRRNPEWTRMYSARDEIQSYLKDCVARYGLAPYIRLNTALRHAAWDEAASLWHITASDGSTYRARVLISAVGALHVPKYPDIKGLERFAGPKFHSTYWNDGVQLAGKRVGVIGTGASAIQFVPEIAPTVGKLSLFQRTPPWIVPKVDFAFPERWKGRFRRIPGMTWAFRTALFWLYEFRVFGFMGKGMVRRRAVRMASEHLAAQVSDPKLREALTPKYEFGCKRVLISSNFYPAIQRSNVELVTEAITEVREHSIVTDDGQERSVDVIIYGTGFRATEPLLDTTITGQNGVELHDAWKDRVSAYLGITVDGFPNFFILLGPNTGLGHNSVVLMSEAQVNYVMGCMKLLDRNGGKVIALRPGVQQRYVEGLKQRLAHTVWQDGGCRSWYQDAATGENPVIWPGSVVSYQRRTRTASAADYEFSAKQNVKRASSKNLG